MYISMFALLCVMFLVVHRCFMLLFFLLNIFTYIYMVIVCVFLSVSLYVSLFLLFTRSLSGSINHFETIAFIIIRTS